MKYLSIHLSIYLYTATGLSKALINQPKKGDRRTERCAERRIQSCRCWSSSPLVSSSAVATRYPDNKGDDTVWSQWTSQDNRSAMESERPSEAPWHCRCESHYCCDCAEDNPYSQIGPVGTQTLHRRPVRTSQPWGTQGTDSASPLDPPLMSLNQSRYQKKTWLESFCWKYVEMLSM